MFGRKGLENNKYKQSPKKGRFFMFMSTESRPEYLMSVPKRGIQIIPPEHVRRVMAMAKQHTLEGTRWSDEEKSTLWPQKERARIRAITSCKILRQRYPKLLDGQRFMESVDYERRDQLLGYAKELTEEIVSSWQTINSDEPIAVVLFGSVAKGLVKNCRDGDPSNIDLAVIGKIKDHEKDELFDAIRNKRKEIQERILSSCNEIDSPESNPGNAGVFIQDVSKIEKGKYGDARNYISSGAIALHDPSGIWERIEDRALQIAAEKFHLD